MKFSELCVDLKESKNTHQMHLEQMALDGITSLRHAIEIVQDLRNKLYSKSTGKMNSYITMKYDGSPAIVFGYHPETNKFFVGTKSVFAKNSPKLVYTEEDLNYYYDGELKEKLKFALYELKNVVTEGVWQGDLMYTNSVLSRSKIDEVEYIMFKPNTISYAVKSDSDFAKKISASKMGIVIHTKYSGSKLEEFVASYDNIDFSSSSTRACVVFSPKIENLTGIIGFTQLEYENVTRYLSVIGKEFNNLSKEFYDDFNYHIAKYFEMFVNHLVKEGKVIDTKFLIEFDIWLQSYYEKHYFSKLGEAGRKTRGIELAIKRTWIERNTHHINSLIKIYVGLAEAKKIFIDKFNEIQHTASHYLETETGFKLTNPEGYCVVNDGDIIKMVDRLEFSKNNFNIARKWKK